MVKRDLWLQSYLTCGIKCLYVFIRVTERQRENQNVLPQGDCVTNEIIRIKGKRDLFHSQKLNWVVMIGLANSKVLFELCAPKGSRVFALIIENVSEVWSILMVEQLRTVGKHSRFVLGVLGMFQSGFYCLGSGSAYFVDGRIFGNIPRFSLL